MEINQTIVSNSKFYIKCPYPMNPEGIVVHNTANKASARNEINYMINNNNEVSFHFAIDDKEIIQGLPLDRNSWNAGDGGNGAGNRKHISIEICYSTHEDLELFKKAEGNAARFIALILRDKNWGIDKVKKHQDFSKKNCPHKTLELGWQRFLDMISGHLNVIKDVTPEKYEREYSEKGKFVCKVDYIDFYNEPNRNSDVTGTYFNDEYVHYDKVVWTDKYVYISWISASAGVRRYMPVRPRGGKLLGIIS